MLKWLSIIILSFSVIACGDDEGSDDGLPYDSNYCNWTDWNRFVGDQYRSCSLESRPTCSSNYVQVSTDQRSTPCAWGSGVSGRYATQVRVRCCLQK